jgi:glycosyltransferase involved in cell wall biosynthesis
LFQRAQCFLFPSLHEGFGLPAIEAMQLGCAVVASTAPAMPEVLGSAAVLCDPDDVDAWAAAVEHVCSDEGSRRQLVESGRARAATYSWRASAEKLAGILQETSGDG